MLHTTTTNGCAAYSTTLSACLDLFGKIGSMRNTDVKTLKTMFDAAYTEDAETAIRTMQWVRDIRGGSGQRKIYRDLLMHLMQTKRSEIVLRILKNTPEIGRWDDMLHVYGMHGAVDSQIETMIADALVNDKNQLCAKWLPRKGPVAVRLTKAFGLTPRQYRKLLVSLTNVVETKMCANQWDQIEFGKLPSVAARLYKKAFARQTPENYEAYLEALTKGEAKVNAGAVYPYQIVSDIYTNSRLAEAQWKALPDFINGSTENILACIDTSYSMHCATSIKGVDAMDAAISIGLYVAERSKGLFHDKFVNFDSSSRMYDLSNKKTLTDRVSCIKQCAWGGSTNFTSTFNLILDFAVKNNIPEQDMPTKILVLSDMQFDSNHSGHVAWEEISLKYQEAGYKRPDIIFWDLSGNVSNSPVTAGTQGTAMVSGLSPSILKTILSGTVVSPMQIMFDALQDPRYSF